MNHHQESTVLQKRKLPKLMACMTKTSIENMRNKALFNLTVLDAKGLRRRKLPLHECLILELKESGYLESASYFEDLIYDNMQLIAEDEIGIVVDIRKELEYLDHICAGLQRAEKEREKGDTKLECLELLNLALFYGEKGKGILWLAEKFFLAAIAVSSHYLIDGGRQKSVCKYLYAKFLLEKSVDVAGNAAAAAYSLVFTKCTRKNAVDLFFLYPELTVKNNLYIDYQFDEVPGAETEESCNILTSVRIATTGRDWKLYENENGDEPQSDITVFVATSILLHRVLLDSATDVRKTDMAKAERLCRLAERRARDAGDNDKIAEAIVAMGECQLAMNNLNNSLKSFKKAFNIYSEAENIQGLCETRMHLAATLQKLGDHMGAAKLLTEMGCLAMEHNLRRHLGRALHLLGELHLRRGRPELGTQHLAEAFTCFMGADNQIISQTPSAKPTESSLMLVGKQHFDRVVYYEEAEQSRLTKAISSGQELMAMYFDLLRENETCAVSRIKVIEWKFSGVGWWVQRKHHKFLPCDCPVHHRRPLDVVRLQQKMIEEQDAISVINDHEQSQDKFFYTISFDDVNNLRSTLGISEQQLPISPTSITEEVEPDVKSIAPI